MKKTITKFALALGALFSINAQAQTLTFEELTLADDSSYYKNTNGDDWTNGPATFQYDWHLGWAYWSGGSSYTNMTDSTHGDYTNLYGCIAHNGYNGSNNYVTMKSGAVVSFSNNTTMVSGFYITNTTYAYKSIKHGDSFARKFGDTTGTNCNGLYSQGEYPDWFRVVVKGYRGGNLLTDSVTFYLADYRTSADYAIKNWQYVNCSSLEQVDSIVFKLNSSDTGSFGMNTPAFFAIDNLELASTVGVEELSSMSEIGISPNPINGNLKLNYTLKSAADISIVVTEVTGKKVYDIKRESYAGQNQTSLELSYLETGVYFVEMNDGTQSKKLKFIKL